MKLNRLFLHCVLFLRVVCDMEKRYIGIYAKNLSESHQFQNELFDKGFEWTTSGRQLVNATNFYARLEDMKIITCYHDPSIDDESIAMSLDDLRSLVVDGKYQEDTRGWALIKWRLSHFRAELAKREPMDLRAVDIPHGTIVLEK